MYLEVCFRQEYWSTERDALQLLLFNLYSYNASLAYFSFYLSLLIVAVQSVLFNVRNFLNIFRSIFLTIIWVDRAGCPAAASVQPIYS